LGPGNRARSLGNGGNARYGQRWWQLIAILLTFAVTLIGVLLLAHVL
jgi:hypothetical protein